MYSLTAEILVSSISCEKMFSGIEVWKMHELLKFMTSGKNIFSGSVDFVVLVLINGMVYCFYHECKCWSKLIIRYF